MICFLSTTTEAKSGHFRELILRTKCFIFIVCQEMPAVVNSKDVCFLEMNLKKTGKRSEKVHVKVKIT